MGRIAWFSHVNSTRKYVFPRQPLSQMCALLLLHTNTHVNGIVEQFLLTAPPSWIQHLYQPWPNILLIVMSQSPHFVWIHPKCPLFGLLRKYCHYPRNSKHARFHPLPYLASTAPPPERKRDENDWLICTLKMPANHGSTIPTYTCSWVPSL